jgi:hypothetical protein
VVCMLLSATTYAGNYTWTGTTNTSWNTNTNWSPNGVPGSSDTITINTTTTSLVLTGKKTVKRLVMTNDTLNLGGDTLEITTSAGFNGGHIINGVCYPQATGLLSFAGTTFGAEVKAKGQIKLNGSTFNSTAYFEHTGSAAGTGSGGNTFNGTTTLKNAGTSTFQLAGSSNDTFNGNLTVINASPSGSANMQLSHGATSYFNGNVEVSSSVSYGVSFSGAGNGSSYLASGKTLSIGSGGFTGTLLIRNFNQDGSTAQTLSLSGILNIMNSDFEGALTATTGNLLLTGNSFHGNCTFTKTTNSNDYSAGGNHFYGTLSLTNSVTNTATVRFASTDGDIYDGDVTLNTSTGNIQFAYSDTSEFKRNISKNSSKITFNNSTGYLLCSGSFEQSFSGTTDYVIGKLIINKSSGIITLQKALTVDSILTLTSGILFTDSINLITLKAGSVSDGGSTTSYIDGVVAKIGNSAFTFPVGSNGEYYPVLISGQTSTTDKFICRYYSVGQSIDTLIDTSLNYISQCRYWYLNRLVGTSKVKATFPWNWNDCELNNPDQMRIAKWDSSIWKNLDSISYTGNFESAVISPNDSLSRFGYFTFASIVAPYTWENYWQCGDVEIPESTTATCTNNSTAYHNKYKRLETYIPSITDPIKTIKVNYIIIQSALVPGIPTNRSNFAPFDPDPAISNQDQNRLNAMTGWLNGDFYQNLNTTHSAIGLTTPHPSLVPPPQPINDSRIRFEVVGTYVYIDPVYFDPTNNQNYLMYDESSAIRLNRWLSSIDPSKMDELNIFWVGRNVGTLSGAAIPPVQNLSANSGVVMYNRYAGGNATNDYNTASTLAHELGHCLGLYHSYGPSTCTQTDYQYLYDLFGYSTTNPPQNNYCAFYTGQSNDLMGSQQDCKHQSPLQMGWMHRTLSLTNMRKYVKCDNNYGGEMVVNSAETWDFDIRVYKNIRIVSGGTLNLTCNLTMSPTGKIIVEDGGKLNVDGGKITSVCDLWDGIEVWGNRNQGQGNVSTTGQGLATFKNSAEVSNAQTVVTTIKTDPITDIWDWNKTGGIIQAENSSFINNIRSFQFLSYHNFRTGYPSQYRNNISYIHNCIFNVTNNLIYPYKHHYADITMYDVQGISIKGNTFTNTAPSSIYTSLSEKGAGIISIDSRFNLSPLGTDRNVFENLWYGVYCSNSVSANSLSISNTDFTDCNTSVYANNINFLRIWGNNFHVPIRSPKSPDLNVPSVGIYLDNCPSYLIENNSISSTVTGDANYGMYVVNSGDQPNYVYNNTIDGFKTAGIIAYDVNDGPLMFDGLIINCNDFDHQVKDEIYVGKLPGSLAHGIGSYQGLCTNSYSASRNRFYSGVCGGSNLELEVSTNSNPLSVIEYASSDPNSDAVLNCSTPVWVNNSLCTTLNFNKATDCPPFVGNPLSQIRSTIAAYDEEIGELVEELNDGLSNNLEFTIRSGGLDSSIVSDMTNASPYISQNYLIAVIDHLDEYNEAGIFDEIKALFIQNCRLTKGVLNYLRFKSEGSDLAQILLDSTEAHSNDTNDALDILIGLDNAINLRRFNAGAYLSECAVSDDTLYQSSYSDTCISYLNNYSNYLLKHDSYLLSGDYTTAISMLDSIDGAISETGLHDFLYTLDTIKSRDASQLFGANSIEDVIWEEKDGVSKVSAMIRGILTMLNDSIFEPTFPEEESGSRIAKSNDFIHGSDYIVRLFPNPTNDDINYLIESTSDIQVTLQIYDINGRFINSQNLNGGNNVVNLKALKAGIYIGRLIDEKGENKHSRFVKL